MSKRKLWKVVELAHIPIEHRPESERKAWQYADAALTNGHRARIYVDERDGRGWKLFETLQP